MNLDNLGLNLNEIILSDPNGVVRYIGYEAAKHIKNENYLKYCYSEGQSLKDDTLLILNYKDAHKKNDLFEVEPNQAIIRTVDKNEQLSLICPINVGRVFDTVFNGNKLKLFCNSDLSEFSLSVGEREYKINQIGTYLIIIRNNDVVYHNILCGTSSLDVGSQPLKWPLCMPKEVHSLELNRNESFETRLIEKEEFADINVVGFEEKGEKIIVHSSEITVEEELYILDRVFSLKKYNQLSRMLKNAEDLLFIGGKTEEDNQSVPLLKQKHYMRAAASNLTILITGESGVGKTKLAKEIHEISSLREGPFVHVNCASIPNTLLESELFGYETGAFTGASKKGKKGYLDIACDGTLFLDEISEIPKELQGKLLDALQSKAYYRVGGTERVTTNARILAATNKDLYQEVEAGTFREDLYYRLCVFPIHIPPLRERFYELEDILDTLMPKVATELGFYAFSYTEQFLNQIKTYDWPGNIRELENLVKRSLISSDDGILRTANFLKRNQKEPSAYDMSLKQYLETMESELLRNMMTAYGNDIEMLCEKLDISRSGLYEKLKKHDIGRRYDNAKK